MLQILSTTRFEPSDLFLILPLSQKSSERKRVNAKKWRMRTQMGWLKADLSQPPHSVLNQLLSGTDWVCCESCALVRYDGLAVLSNR